MFSTHILSALVSSFLFVSAALELPNFFVRAQEALRLGDQWSGVQRNLITNEVALEATFIVPGASGKLGAAAFIGITLGRTISADGQVVCGGTSSIYSTGVLIEIIPNDAQDSTMPRYTLFRESYSRDSRNGIFKKKTYRYDNRIIAGDTIQILTYATSGKPTGTTVMKYNTPAWSRSVSSMTTELTCQWVAEWKVGTIKAKDPKDSSLGRYRPLPDFGQVTFYDAYMATGYGTKIPVALQGLDARFWDIWWHDRIELVNAIPVEHPTPSNDGSRLIIRQLPENMPA